MAKAAASLAHASTSPRSTSSVGVCTGWRRRISPEPQGTVTTTWGGTSWTRSMPACFQNGGVRVAFPHNGTKIPDLVHRQGRPGGVPPGTLDQHGLHPGIGHRLEEGLGPQFARIDAIAQANSRRVLAAFQKHRVAEAYFAPKRVS